MMPPWPREVQSAITDYRKALHRWQSAEEAIPYSDVEMALLMVGTATVAWAERVGRLPAAPGKPMAALPFRARGRRTA